MDKCMSLLSIQGLGWLLITLRWHFSNGCRTAISPTWTCSTSRRLSGCLQQPGVNCSSNYWLNDKTCEIERDIWIQKAAIRGWQTHRRFFHPYCLLALQAEAFLAIIIKRNVEDKKREKKKKKDQPWALFSLQPSKVTGLLCSAWNLWDDHLWWPGCLSFAVMFSMVMMLPLCLGPQSRHPPCDCFPWLLTAPLKSEGKKIYPPPRLTTQRLNIHPSARLIYVIFPDAGIHQVWTRRFKVRRWRFENDLGTTSARRLLSRGLEP